MANKIQIKRGIEANLPTLDVGEPAFTTDTKKPFIGSDTGNVELATKEQINSLDDLDVITRNNDASENIEGTIPLDADTLGGHPPEYYLNNESAFTNFANSHTVIMAHRGYPILAPENSLLSFELAYNLGNRMVETDIGITSDFIPVLLHDTIINRTARDSNGNVLPTEINVSSVTYDQLLQYDFGVWKGEQFKGTKITKFEDFIYFCKVKSIIPVIELKNGYTNAHIKNVYDIVKKYGMMKNVIWNSFQHSYLDYIYSLTDKTNFLVNTDGDITDDIVTKANTLKTNYNTVYTSSDYRYTTESGIQKAINNDLKVAVYTIDDVNIAKNMLKIGASVICTNQLLISDLY